MRTFLLKIGVFFSIITIGLILIYAMMDPQGSTRGDVRYIKTQNVMDKTEKFDALLIGSSRVYDVANVKDCNFSIYNYGFIQALPKDFPSFIKHARENQPIKKIILGLDFFGTSTKGLNDATAAWKASDKYVDDIKSQHIGKQILGLYDFPRFKRLINYKILGNDPFERGEVQQQPVNKQWKPVFWNIYKSAYNSYTYNDSLNATYRRIRNVSEGTDLVVYITPESELLFKLMVDTKLQGFYERFLHTAVQEFDTVYNMMEINNFTQSPENFKDESHLTNDKLHTIVCKLANGEGINSGTILTKANIDDYIQNKMYLKNAKPTDTINSIVQTD